MSKMDDKIKNEMFQKNPHLKKYMEYIKRKMKEPEFYSALPYEVREE